MSQPIWGTGGSRSRPMVAPRPARSRVKALATALGLALALAGAWTLLPHGGRGDKIMPDELLGVWTTTAPAYADRAMEIKPTTLIFHTGGGSSSVHPVRRVVRVERGGGSALYTVEYGNAGAVETLSFQYVRAHRPAIRLRNQRFVWRQEMK